MELQPFARLHSAQASAGKTRGNPMENQAATASAAAILAGLKKSGIDFVATLPDEKMLELIRAVEKDTEIKHVPLCREEEGIGICAGAYLAGKKTAIIMQNAGFLNSCNALTTTSLQFQIPILMLIYYAGDIGDRGFTTLGSVTEPVLQAMGFRTYVLRNKENIDETLRGAQILADDSKKPVAVLLTKTVLGVE
jgi:sulfopyruvate decarboxylase subunit alpha